MNQYLGHHRRRGPVRRNFTYLAILLRAWLAAIVATAKPPPDTPALA